MMETQYDVFDSADSIENDVIDTIIAGCNLCNELVTRDILSRIAEK